MSTGPSGSSHSRVGHRLRGGAVRRGRKAAGSKRNPRERCVGPEHAGAGPAGRLLKDSRPWVRNASNASGSSCLWTGAARKLQATPALRLAVEEASAPAGPSAHRDASWSCPATGAAPSIGRWPVQWSTEQLGRAGPVFACSHTTALPVEADFCSQVFSGCKLARCALGIIRMKHDRLS